MKPGRDWSGWRNFGLSHLFVYICMHHNSGRPFPTNNANGGAFRMPKTKIFTIKSWGKDGYA